MTTGADAANPAVYGEFVNPFVLAKDQIVEIVVNNLGKILHSLTITPLTSQTPANTPSISTVTISRPSFAQKNQPALSTPQTPVKPSTPISPCAETPSYSVLKAISCCVSKRTTLAFGFSIGTFFFPLSHSQLTTLSQPH